MSSLPGTLTLQQAMSCTSTSQTIASIDSSKLQLGEKREVANISQHSFPRYYQTLTYDGTGLFLQTPAVKLTQVFLIE